MSVSRAEYRPGLITGWYTFFPVWPGVRLMLSFRLRRVAK